MWLFPPFIDHFPRETMGFSTGNYTVRKKHELDMEHMGNVPLTCGNHGQKMFFDHVLTLKDMENMRNHGGYDIGYIGTNGYQTWVISELSGREMGK